MQELDHWTEVDRIRPQVAFITNPTALHIETALQCARRGMAIFIEKPLGGCGPGLEELMDIVRRQKVVTYVAYVLRFHPVILKLKEMMGEQTCWHMQVEAASFLPTWRPGRDHTKSYSARRDLGGGVIFDLSHEIDYVHFLLGQVQRINGHCYRRGNVTVDAEDCADMLIHCPRGVANVHLSFLSHHHRRSIRLCFAERTITADLLANTIHVYQHDHCTEAFTLPIERDALFEKQMDFFWSNVHNPAMMNNVLEAADLFKKICDFREQQDVR